MKYKKINRLYFLIFLSLSLSFLVTSYANAATYYVDQNHPSAGDSNPGTEALPWKTINHAAQVLLVGDTVLIKEGEYFVGEVAKGDYFRGAIQPANSGTSGNPITFKAYPGHRVKLTGKYRPIGAYQRNYITYDGFILESTATVADGDNYKLEGGVIIHSSDGVIIQNCEIIGHFVNIYDNHEAIRIDNSTDILIENNIIHGVHGGNGSFGIKSYDMEDSIIEHNTIYDCDGGFMDKSGGVNNKTRYNLFYDCKQVVQGSANSPQQDCQFYQNIAYTIYSDGVFNQEAVGLLANNQNFQVFNNVFYDIYLYTIGYGSVGSSVSVWNNIFMSVNTVYSNSAKAVLQYSDYNCFYQYTNKNNSGFDEHSIDSNPLFTNVAIHNFHLQGGSPCINAGIDKQDYDGDGNTTEKINMGAYITGNEIIGAVRDRPWIYKIE